MYKIRIEQEADTYLYGPWAEYETSAELTGCVSDPYILSCFEPYKDEPRAFHRKQLDDIAGVIARSQKTRLPIYTVNIIGHAATFGSGSKQDLAFRRASRVKSALAARLAELGVASSQVMLKSFTVGDNTPLASNDTRAGRTLNRRVEIKLLRKRLSPKTDPRRPARKKKDPTKPKDPASPLGDCGLSYPDLVETWKVAIHCLNEAQIRLEALARIPMSDRISLWNDADSAERRWFGKYDAARLQTTRWIVSGALTALRSENLIVFCTSVKKHFKCRRAAAFVASWRRNLDTPGIWLCPSFLRLGYNHKVFVYIHEAAHLAGADKRVERYPQLAALRLARLRPNAAVLNAQNHAFYVSEVGLALSW